MDDKDHVFARFQENKPASSDRRREVLTIPRRAGASGSRTVEVVHVKSSNSGKERTRRADAQLRAVSWDGGFPMRQPVLRHPPAEPAPVEAAEPVAHVMPAWEPSAPVIEELVSPPPSAAMPIQRTPRRHARRVADPFDAGDDGANCMRCGYAIEAAREKRGRMTCAACG